VIAVDRKLNALMEEYVARVGQQAAVIYCTPGKSQHQPHYYKVVGSQPLQNVVSADACTCTTATISVSEVMTLTWFVCLSSSLVFLYGCKITGKHPVNFHKLREVVDQGFPTRGEFVVSGVIGTTYWQTETDGILIFWQILLK